MNDGLLLRWEGWREMVKGNGQWKRWDQLSY